MERESAALEWITQLVRFDSTSRNSNLGLIEHVRDWLAHRGLDPWLTYDSGRGKANLFATVPAADGGLQGGLVLSGHTDVVPVDGQDWHSDPFVPEIRDGRLVGRGTADMKGFIGCVLANVPRFQSLRLPVPVHLALSFDEEVGCLGAPLMLREMQARGLQPAGCIVGEPTRMQMVTGHKGINSFRCELRGVAAHSSMPEAGVNTIAYAARLITFIQDLADELRERGPRDAAYDVPYSTAQVGTVRGGSARNIVPDACEFDFELRNLPETDVAACLRRIQEFVAQVLLPQMRRGGHPASIEIVPLAAAPSLSSDDQAWVTRLLRQLSGDRGVHKVAFGTEAGQFQQSGVPTVVFGPGDIRVAHRPDEYLELEQVAQCERFLAALAQALADERQAPTGHGAAVSR